MRVDHEIFLWQLPDKDDNYRKSMSIRGQI